MKYNTISFEYLLNLYVAAICDNIVSAWCYMFYHTGHIWTPGLQNETEYEF